MPPVAPVGGGGADPCILNNCTLSTNSANGCGGGTYSSTLMGCTLAGNQGYGGGGDYGGTLSNCVLSGNVAWVQGGGAESASANNCSFQSNVCLSYFGGGAQWCMLTNCDLTGNSSGLYGGGASDSTLCDCIVTNNSAHYYGGVSWCTAYNCVISHNSAYYGGGGAGFGALYNCLVSYNSAQVGGGAWGSVLNNCTVVSNSASVGYGGGVCNGTLNNCIVYYNLGAYEPNYDGGMTLNYCCTTPAPGNGIANFTNEPLFVDIVGGDLRLQPNSPCINADQDAYISTATDLAGNPRIVGGKVDVGAYEFQPPLLQVNQLGLLAVTNLPNLDPSLRQRSMLTFFYSDRLDLLADGWSFWATNPIGVGARNTEITNSADGAMVDYNQTAHLGEVWIPCDVGDLEASANNSRNSLFRALPTNWVSARLRISFVPTVNFQQAHLGLYQDDDNYLEVGIGFNSERGGANLSMAFETNGSPTVTLRTNLVNGTWPSLFFLQLDRDPVSETTTGSSSLDGVNWTTLGSLSPFLRNPRLMVRVGAAPAPWSFGQPSAELIELDLAVSNTIPRALTYTLLNPPNGASIDGNGVITWTPTQTPGTYTLTSVVSDNWTPPWSVTNTFIVVVPAPPQLSVTATGSNVSISWPSSLTNYELESASDLLPGSLWKAVTNLTEAAGGAAGVTIAPSSRQQFFRLHRSGP